MFRLNWGKRKPLGGFLTPSEIVVAYDEGIEALFDPARYVAGFHSGLSALDRVAGGLRRGTLTVLCGPPGAGKTTLALSYLRSAVLVHQTPTAIFPPAMTPERLLLRLIAADTRIPLVQFTQHGLSPEQAELAHATWRRLSQAPLHILNSPEINMKQLRRSLAALMQRTQVEFVVVDPVEQLGTQPRPVFSDLSRMADCLAGIARDFHVAVLAVTTTSRLGSSFSDNYTLWEQHASRMLELRGPSAELREGNVDWDAEVVVGRNDHGPTGLVRLRFDSTCLRFAEVT